MEETVDNIILVAKADVKERRKIIIYTFAGTTVLLTILQFLLSISWDAERLQISTSIPWMVIIPWFLMILYGIISKIIGKNRLGQRPLVFVCY